MATRERDRIERRQFEQEQMEAEETRLAPLRAAENQFKETTLALAKAERESARRVALEGKDTPAFVASLLSEPMKTIRLKTLEEANEHNHREALKFVAQTPGYYQSPDNAALLADWCHRNDVLVCDAATWANIYRHLDSLGLMEHEPVRQSDHPVIERQRETTPIQPQTIMGRDTVTGAPKEWHPSELDRLSADDYRKALDLPTKQVVEYREHGIRW